MPVELITLITAVATAVIGFCRWAVKLWADVRRETIVANEKRSEADRGAAARLASDQRQDQLAARAELVEMNGRLMASTIEQTKSNTALELSNRALGDKVDRLTQRLDDMQRELTPVHGHSIPDLVRDQPSRGERPGTGERIMQPRPRRPGGEY